MKSTKNLLPIASLVITFLLSGCASAPSHLIIAPEIMAQSVIQHVDQQATLNVIDMRTANHIVQILREGEAATLFSAQERLENIIKNSLSKHWKNQGLTIQASAVNSINVAIEKAIISVTQETMSYQVQTEIVLKVSINNSVQTLTSIFNNRGNSEGPFKADIAVLERNFNQRLANLLQQILANEKINHFLK
ncbi:YajG family lipoprotein [Candidatus Colwellia aromaticivorans]|uniref:YajG family lipoprotein n=1 Tax=Candidatus Colwellia aromaticivorans TaxID=2267621 RepID=UPI000DF16159|nr:YajG family lipoprotein [Candidatus Colwellia aromaticivorans]